MSAMIGAESISVLSAVPAAQPANLQTGAHHRFNSLARDFFENFGGVPFGAGLVPDVAYFCVRPNPVRHAHDSEERFAEETLHAPRAVDLDGVEIRIRKQRKIQIVLGLEFRLLLDGIRAATQNYGVQLVEFFLRVAKLGRFIRSTRRQRLGKKEEDHVFSAQIRQGNFLAVIGGQFEFRRPFADFQWLSHLFSSATVSSTIAASAVSISH